jgi:hypothetical protein
VREALSYKAYNKKAQPKGSKGASLCRKNIWELRIKPSFGMTDSLMISSLHTAMDEALKSDAMIIQKLKKQGLIWRRTKDQSDWEALLTHVLSCDGKSLVHGKAELHLKLPFHFGMTLHAEGGPDGGDPNSSIRGAVTFYIAYSTWEGKFLYVDHLARNDSSTEVLALETMAKIAVSLNCARLVWRVRNPGTARPRPAIFSTSFLKRNVHSLLPFFTFLFRWMDDFFLNVSSTNIAVRCTSRP